MSVKNSSTAGFLVPSPQPPTLVTVPPRLTLLQFIQTLLVGLSGFPGNLVRPDWQPEPPKQPDLSVNWLAYGVKSVSPDANAYVGYDNSNNPFLQRNELLQVALSIYGPDAYDNVGLIRDGLQLQQNNASLKQANMGFAYDNPAQHMPDLVNERWIEKYIMDIYLRRQRVRDYPILSFLSANGTIYSQTEINQDFQQNWQVGS